MLEESERVKSGILAGMRPGRELRASRRQEMAIGRVRRAVDTVEGPQSRAEKASVQHAGGARNRGPSRRPANQKAAALTGLGPGPPAGKTHGHRE